MSCSRHEVSWEGEGTDLGRSPRPLELLFVRPQHFTPGNLRVDRARHLPGKVSAQVRARGG